MISVRRYLPAEALRPCFASYYIVEVEPENGQPVTDKILPELAGLRLQLEGQWQAEVGGDPVEPMPESILTGFGTQSMTVSQYSRGCLFGIAVKPIGWRQFFKIDAHYLTDQAIDARSIAGPSLSRLLDQMRELSDDAGKCAVADAFFLADLDGEIPRSWRRVQQFERVTASVDTETRVDDIASAMELSPRQLERWALQSLGYSPKLFLRKQRFLNSIAILNQARSHSWRHLSMLGYCDQSHFIGEFKRFVGCTPGQYFAEDHHLWDLLAKTRDEVAAIGHASLGQPCDL